MKQLALLLAAAMLLICCFACAACSSDETTSSNPPANSSNQPSSAAPASSEPSSQDDASEAVSSEESSAVSADTSSEESTDTPAAENLFWLTHFEDASREGAGVIFTQADLSGAWWTHVSFAPVEGQANVYQVVEICNGGIDGSGVSLAIPEGGFVYAMNRGNDYPALYAQDPNTYAQYANEPNYRSEAGADMMACIATWNVGDRIRIEGLDLDAQTIPTETPDLNWYDPSYVCTARWVFAE